MPISHMLAAVASLAALWGWYVSWRWAGDIDRTRAELKAADDVGEGLCRELAGLRESLEAAHTQLELLERANYQLACELHGKAAVDRAIADARERGVN